MSVRRRKGEASLPTEEEETAIEVEVDSDGFKLKSSSKKRKPKSTKVDSQRKYDHLGREIGPDGWFVDPAQLPIQKRNEKMCGLSVNRYLTQFPAVLHCLFHISSCGTVPLFFRLQRLCCLRVFFRRTIICYSHN
jgi:hypothetical protein